MDPYPITSNHFGSTHQHTTIHPHVHLDEVDSSTPPSSHSDGGAHVKGKEPMPPHRHLERHTTSRSKAKRNTGTAFTFAKLLGREESDPSSIDAHTHSHSFSPPSPSPRHHFKFPRGPHQLRSLLLLTTERLEQETSRAVSAEQRLSSLLPILATARSERDSAMNRISSMTVTLNMYKSQLDVAQKEIYRAQEVVDKLERERLQIEDSYARERTRVRRLEQEKAARSAMEEGRRLGFREGLERGKQMVLEEMERQGYWEGDIEEDGHEDDEESMSSPSSRSRKEDAVPRGVNTHLPAPIHVTSTQPQNQGRISSETPSQSNRPLSRSQSRRNYLTSTAVLAPSQSPEFIRPISEPHTQPRPQSRSRRETGKPSNLQDNRPISVQNAPPSPSISHRSIPPDNYIPLMGADSVISLPPPFELSQTPRTWAMSVTEEDRHGRNSRTANAETVGAGDSREIREDRERRGSRDPRGRQLSGKQRIVEDHIAYPGRVETASTASRGSMSISQLDIVSPPKERTYSSGYVRGDSDRRTKDGYSRFTEDFNQEYNGRRTPSTPTPAPRGTNDANGRQRTATEQIVEEWRSANSDVAGSSVSGNKQDNNRHYTNDDGHSSGLVHSPHVTSWSHAHRGIAIPVPRATADLPQVNNPHHYEDVLRRQNIYALSSPHNYSRNADPKGLRSPIQGTRRLTAHRSRSSPQEVEISVQPPSKSPSGHSQETVLDPVLLTPEDANHAMPLPAEAAQQYPDNTQLPSSQLHQSFSLPGANDPMVTIPLPDGQFPPGFVPRVLSPRPSLYENEALKHPDPPPRPSTSSTSASNMKGVNPDATSPAPLNRPLSLFSES